MAMWGMRGIISTPKLRAVLLLVIVGLLSVSGWLQRFDWLVYDEIISRQSFQPDSDIVIVAIDEESLRAIGKWPWSRELYAELIDRLSQVGSNVVALDLLLSEPDSDHPEADKRLKTAIFTHRNVVLPVAPAQNASGDKFFLIQPLASLQRRAILGHVDIELDRDGVARRTFLYAGIDIPAFPALGLVLADKGSLSNRMHPLSQMPGADKTVVNTGNSWVRSREIMVPFAGPPGTYPRISYARLLNDDELLDDLRGKIIIVGMTATGLRQGFLTPVSLTRNNYMSGVEWHASVADMLRNGRSIYPVPEMVTIVVTVLWVLAVLLVVNVAPGWFRSLVLLVSLAAGVGLVMVLLSVFHIWLPPGTALTGTLAVYPLQSWQRINEFIQSQFITGSCLQAVFDSVQEGVITVDARGNILYLNQESEHILGARSEYLIGKPLEQLIEICLIPDKQDKGVNVSESADTHPDSRIQHCVLTLPSGDRRTIRVTHRALYDRWRTPAGAVVTISDISDALEMKQQIARQANYDVLTMLPSRNFLLSRFGELAASAQQYGAALIVCLVSVDNFSKINDALGYHSGDTLLKMIADRLLKLVCNEDLIARWSGDEFMLVVDRPVREGQELQFARKVQETINRRFEINGQEVFISASIGIRISSQVDQVDEENEVFLDEAVSAMRRVKRQGGNGFQFYSSGQMNAWTREQLEFERDFRLAIENQDKALHVLFQPIVDVQQKRVVHNEVLVRWAHPTRGLLSPGDFIPLAERVGLIGQLGDLVLWISCRIAADLAKVGQAVDISVNVASRQLLHPDFLQKVAGVLERTGLPAERLMLEITENAVISDLPRAAEALVRLKALGVAIALDDFGTGYSSLSLLRELPLDILKIDKSFIQSIEQDHCGGEKFDFAIARAIIALGDNLGLRVIAEGVETERHMEFLRRHRCYLQQGYYFSRPLSTTQLMQFMGRSDSIRV
ncbi:EAL domain-containing protein [Nitrosomonas sp.]|uniref:EAL domain-containing protein n=1 Tax=Nitrosomonas sp. TaxID=42353 RepID=UPI003305DE98